MVFDFWRRNVVNFHCASYLKNYLSVCSCARVYVCLCLSQTGKLYKIYFCAALMNRFVSRHFLEKANLIRSSTIKLDVKRTTSLARDICGFTSFTLLLVSFRALCNGRLRNKKTQLPISTIPNSYHIS